MPRHFKSVMIIGPQSKHSGSQGGYWTDPKGTWSRPKRHDGCEFEILRAVDDQAPPDEAVETLRDDCVETLSALRRMLIKDNQFMTLRDRLEKCAQDGLDGPDPNAKNGALALRLVRADMITAMRGHRSRYLATLMASSFVIVVITFGLVLMMQYLSEVYKDQIDLNDHWVAILNGLLLHPGAALGVLFIGFVRNRNMTFETVKQFDAYDFSPWLRFSYTAIVGYVLFALLLFEWLQIGALGKTVDLHSNRLAGFAIGLVCGIAEGSIVPMLMKASANAVKEPSASS